MKYYITKISDFPIEKWAETTLTEDEKISFQQALEENSTLLNQYIQMNLISIEPLYEEISNEVLGGTMQIKVGEKIILNSTIVESDIPSADSWVYWRDRYTYETQNHLTSYYST